MSVLSTQSAAVGAYTLTVGRFVGSVAALMALAGVVIGARALTRSASHTSNGKRSAVVGLVAGVTGIVTSGMVLAVADGGPGTGNGVVGGFAGLAFGLIATALSWLALARSRRTA